MPKIITPFRKVPKKVLPSNSSVANTVLSTIQILTAALSAIAGMNSAPDDLCSALDVLCSEHRLIHMDTDYTWIILLSESWIIVGRNG
jgi:hypothetical protein